MQACQGFPGQVRYVGLRAVRPEQSLTQVDTMVPDDQGLLVLALTYQPTQSLSTSLALMHMS